jgi:hypothetical protein
LWEIEEREIEIETVDNRRPKGDVHYLTPEHWKLKPIEGFRFLRRGSLKTDPFQTIPAKTERP